MDLNKPIGESVGRQLAQWANGTVQQDGADQQRETVGASTQQGSDAAAPSNLVLDLSIQINEAESQQLVNAVLQEAAKSQIEGKLTKPEFMAIQKCADERRKQLRGK